MQKPLIAVMPLYDQENKCEVYPETYCEALKKAGAITIVFSLNLEYDDISAYVEKVDGILFTGGQDVNPVLYKEEPTCHVESISKERDLLETAVFIEATKRGIPVFGICRGMQIINVCLGGTLYQDIKEEYNSEVNHRDLENINKGSHYIEIKQDTILSNVIGSNELFVNSNHHQGIKVLSDKLTPIAFSKEDNLIEAFVNKDYGFMLGLQWHPELLIYEDTKELSIFKEFVNKCRN